jgi:3-dehydroquinate synthase
MEALHVSDQIEHMKIQSHKGPYQAFFDMAGLEKLNKNVPAQAHFVVDERVAELYAPMMPNVLAAPSVLLIKATEQAKSLENFPAYVDHLVGHSIRRDDVLIAIGGGVLQDITCFLASTMLRGVKWQLYPTTLLAQADSCIGSKSSINTENAKNILGTFTPPNEVVIDVKFLDTLDPRDVRSGVGEMLKVHAIDGPDSFNSIAADYDNLFTDKSIMEHYIRGSLEIKKGYIEVDEFDQGVRNVFNYGHSFGHAIEAATKFAVPHGIAVTMGMDMANYVAAKIGVGKQENFSRMHSVLARNYSGYENQPVPLDEFLIAIGKDKKNIGADLTLILPDEGAQILKGRYPLDENLRQVFGEFFDAARV